MGTRGPEHSYLEAGQPPPKHSTRAEQNHARLIVQPRTTQASSQECCPGHTLLLWPQRQGQREHCGTAGTPVPLRPEAEPGSQPSSWWSQSDTLPKPRSLPSLPLSCTGMRNESNKREEKVVGQDKALTQGWLLVPHLRPTNIMQGWDKSLDSIILK